MDQGYHRQKHLIGEVQPPTNEDEFQEMMERVDLSLRDAGVGIPARPLCGWMAVGSRLGLSLTLVSGDGEPAGDSYESDDLTIRIFRWFSERYGSRLNTFHGPGSVAVMIRGDLWQLELPRVFGKFAVFASRTESGSGLAEGVGEDGVRSLNVVDRLRDLPSGLRATLTQEELCYVHDRFVAGCEALVSVEEHYASPMVPEARADLESAVEHSMPTAPAQAQRVLVVEVHECTRLATIVTRVQGAAAAATQLPGSLREFRIDAKEDDVELRKEEDRRRHLDLLEGCDPTRSPALLAR